MAATKATAKAEETVQKVTIRLNELEKEGNGDVDQTVPVTINGKTETIIRGKLTEVTPDVFMVLKQSGKFPELG